MTDEVELEEPVDITQKVIDKMLEIWPEEQIAHPEHEPKVFKFQVQLAKWCLDNVETSNSEPI